MIIRKHNNHKTHWLVVPFFIKVNLKKVRNNDPDKIDEVGFFSLDKLPTPLHTGLAYTLKKYKKIFAKYKIKRK